MVSAVVPTQFDIIANMERWRWLPADLGERHIFVNIPEFTLRLFDHGQVTHMTRAVVGKPDTATPIFSAAMQSLIINPSWHVPESIIRNEFLPKMADDPTYAERAGYEVTQNGDSVSIRQPPGERNALGFVKFNLPNEHAVYLHDTPLRKLFVNAERAYSHGCVRVENPFALATAVLADPRFVGKLPLFGGVDSARFRRQVVPGDVLDLEVTMGRLGARAGKGSGRASVNGQTACEADLLFVIADA